MENLKFVRMTLENYDKLMPTHSEIFKTLMFGWKITNGEYEENLLEKILMQSENEDLIDLIWSTFKLWQKGFILNMVRIQSFHILIFKETLKFLRKILSENDSSITLTLTTKKTSQLF